MTEPEEALFARAICELIGIAVLNLTEKLQPPRQETERIQTALYLNITESFQAAKILVRADLSAHAGLHIRAMLESFVHLTMLRCDSQYLNQMTFDQIKGELKVQEVLATDPYISEQDKQRLANGIKKLKGRYDELFAKKYRSKKLGDLIKDRGDAKLTHYYASYLRLNSMAHWDLTMLANRHMDENGGMKIFAQSPDNLTIAVLFTAMMVMVSATEAIGTVATFADGVYKKNFNSMNEAWGRYLDRTAKQQR